MDLKESQIWSREQVVVLRALAAAAARPGCKFLEVGSWCGDSTIILASVAQEHGGHVFCVDWWKGNTGTDLAEIASCEDVFASFWDRIRRLGLQDVVVPIRGPSAVAAQVLRYGAFDFAFLDADHSYDGIRSDLRSYAPLVRRAGGILCGHDCEGRIGDYDRAFLEAGKQVDFHESVHCGVVLAVGETFRDYALDHGIWSVRADAGSGWVATDVALPGIERRRQPPPPPVAYSRSYNLLRYGRLVYAVPHARAGLDIADDKVQASLRAAPSVAELERLIGEAALPGSGPVLLETYRHYNLIRHGDRIFALAQALGPTQLPRLDDDELQRLRLRGECLTGTSAGEVKAAIDALAVAAPAAATTAPRQTRLVLNHPRPRAKVSIILLDWGVRESFHTVHYLNQQTVPRDDYELIWVEFYDRTPPELQRLANDPEGPLLDKWLVLGYPDDVYYHKHRMYNAGVALAEGEICVFCDSDAIFTPTFVERLLQAFAETPDAVIHLDEVRNYSKCFYPFNYPALDEVLGEGCVNWTGTVTTGLDDSPDMLHAANYGACMAARRADLIRVGGADEHIDYLGYICGPYELTFRLANFGRQERWLRDEFLYHVWHPNTSGCNVEFKGPDDGRGMSLRALQVRDTGRVEPYKENPAIRHLRGGARPPAEALLALLARDDDGGWQMENALGQAGPQLVEQGYYGFNLIYYRGTWYGLAQHEGAFDPEKVQNRAYAACYAAASRAELLARLPVRLRWLQMKLLELVRRLPRARRLRERLRRLLRPARPAPFPPDDHNPHLVEEDYFGFNIIYYRGSWYGLAQEEGAFSAAKARQQQYARCHVAASREELQGRLAVGPRWLRRSRLARQVLRFAQRHRPAAPEFQAHDEQPHLVQQGYHGFNLIYYRGTWYGLSQEEGAFDPARLQDGGYRRCVTGSSVEAVRTEVRRQRTWKRRAKDLAKAVLRLAPRA